MGVPFGKYELLRKIASGGMGRVFLARDAALGRLVVLKLVLPHLAEDEGFLALFRQEAGLVARLRHPNLVSVHDVGEVQGHPALVMEWVQGDDLRRLERHARERGQPLPVGLALRIVADAAAGLDHAHQARDAHGAPLGLVHRDVSPQNVLVGFDGAVKIIDFGVAKARGAGAPHTATGFLKGKYPYMSPEQASGEPVDARSDQFALGVVLWELCTGRRLFKAESELMTLKRVQECEVPAPSSLHPALPPALDALVLRALARDPAARFESCGALGLALEELLLEARLPSSSAHLAAFLRALYAERLLEESDPARLDALGAGLGDTELPSSPSRTTPDTPPRATPPLAGLEPGRTPRARRPHLALGALALGGALVLGASALLWPRAPAAPTAAALPAPVAVEVRSTPQGALVYLDGVPQPGVTPLTVHVPPQGVARVSLVLGGHASAQVELHAADAARGLDVALTPLVAPRLPLPPPAVAAPRPARPSAPAIKTGR